MQNQSLVYCNEISMQKKKDWWQHSLNPGQKERTKAKVYPLNTEEQHSLQRLNKNTRATLLDIFYLSPRNKLACFQRIVTTIVM